MEEILKYGQETNLYKVRQGSQCDFKDCRACHTFCSGQTVTDKYANSALTPDGILIRNDIGVTPELFFAIAHELRHAYQLENDRSLHDYRTSDQLDIDEYNAQPLEVDANAFAAVVMAEFFGISPQFLNMPESIRQLIYVRKRQIQKELKDG